MPFLEQPPPPNVLETLHYYFDKYEVVWRQMISLKSIVDRTVPFFVTSITSSKLMLKLMLKINVFSML